MNTLESIYIPPSFPASQDMLNHLLKDYSFVCQTVDTNVHGTPNALGHPAVADVQWLRMPRVQWLKKSKFITKT